MLLSFLGTPRFGSGRLAYGLIATASIGSFALTNCKYRACEEARTCEPAVDDGGVGGGNGGEIGGEGGAGGERGSDTEPCENLVCSGACIDPLTNVEYCGAQDSCEGDDSGDVCASDEVCVVGECQLDCGDGLIFCSEACVNPLLDDEYCGATDCDSGEVCSGDSQCVGGVCREWGEAKVPDLFGGDAEYAPIVQMLGDGRAVLATIRESSKTAVLTTTFLPEEDAWTLPFEHSSSGYYPVHFFVMSEQGHGLFGWSQVPDFGEEPLSPHIVQRSTSGDWSPPDVFLDEANASATTPMVCVDDAGRGLAIWTVLSSPTRFFGARLPAGQQEWLAASEVFVDAETPLPLRMNLLPLGEGRCLFTMANSEEDGVRLYSSLGTVAEGFAPIAPVDGLAPESTVASFAAAGSNVGTAVVAWGTTAVAPFTAVVFADGVWSGAIEVPDPGEETGSLRAVLIDGAGSPTLLSNFWAWKFDSQYGTFDAGERTFGPLTEFRNADFAMDGFGNIQVVWGQEAFDETSLWGARYNAYLQEWSSPQLLEDTAPSVQEIDIDFNARGQGIATWWTETASSDGFGYNYFE